MAAPRHPAFPGPSLPHLPSVVTQGSKREPGACRGDGGQVADGVNAEPVSRVVTAASPCVSPVCVPR